ncbi:MAG: sulfurtransferase TusA family protein [Gordonibacter sp.]
MQIIDAFGMQCPKPLVLAKKQIDGGVRELAVQVDNETACKNLTRLGGKTGLAGVVFRGRRVSTGV